MADKDKTKLNDYQKTLLSRSKSLVLLSILIALLIAILILVVAMKNPCNCNCNCNCDNTCEETITGPDIDPNQDDYQEPEKTIIHSKNVIMPGWTHISIPAGTTEVTSGVDLYNPEGNAWLECPDCGEQLDENYKCVSPDCGHQHSAATAVANKYYMTFALTLKGTDEVIYQSGLVEPGKHLQKITLTRPLEAGNYEAYVFLQPYKSDGVTKCNNGKVVVELNVK